MKLLIVRHGDPDYSIDSLTPKGWKEAGFLAERLSKLDIKDMYVSPLGRARDTASLTLKKTGRQAEECIWLREFEGKVIRPDRGERTTCWDWLPEDWMCDERYFDKDKWYTTDIMKADNVKEEYDMVCSELDKLILKHGYRRDGKYYKAVEANNDTVILFCHFGVEAVMLSHLLNVSPMVFWHGLCAAPTSVTTVRTEERREGKVSFRVSEFGDTSHLYAHDEEPAFSARFCECYKNTDERHD